MAHVLLVENDADGREMVRRFLAGQGHAVTAAPDGREALRLLLDGRVDVLVTDLHMPGLDGLQLVEILRSYLRWSDLPVVLLSGHAGEAELAKARGLGVARVFHKTRFDLDDLARAIDDLTRRPQPPSAFPPD